MQGWEQFLGDGITNSRQDQLLAKHLAIVDEKRGLKVCSTFLGILANDGNHHCQPVGFVDNFQRAPGFLRDRTLIGFDDRARIQYKKSDLGIVDALEDTKRRQRFAFNQNEPLGTGKSDEALLRKG
jgi:hypothetical protein